MIWFALRFGWKPVDSVRSLWLPTLSGFKYLRSSQRHSQNEAACNLWIAISWIFSVWFRQWCETEAPICMPRVLDNDDIAFSLAELSGASGHSDDIAMVFSQYGCMRSNGRGFLSCIRILTDISSQASIVVIVASLLWSAQTCSSAAWSNSFTGILFVCPHTSAVEKHASALQYVIRLLTTVPAYTVHNVLRHQRMFGACLS